MVDEIKVPKLVPSLSSTSRVKSVDRRHTELNQQRFKKHLKDEDDQEHEEQEQKEEGLQQRLDRSEQRERSSIRDNDDEQKDETKTQGKLVNVVV